MFLLCEAGVRVRDRLLPGLLAVRGVLRLRRGMMDKVYFWAPVWTHVFCLGVLLSTEHWLAAWFCFSAVVFSFLWKVEAQV